MHVRVAGSGVGTLVVALLALVLLVTIGPNPADAGQITRRERMLSLTNHAREQHRRSDRTLNERLSRYA